MVTLQELVKIKTNSRGFYDITDTITGIVRHASVDVGLCHVFSHHTSASLVLCENADPQVKIDLERFMQRLTPDGDLLFQHVEEGPDDMPAHVRTMLTNSFLTIPITHQQLALGTWQSVYLWEHRLSGSERRVTITIY